MAGDDTAGNGQLRVSLKTGQDLIYAGGSTEGDGVLLKGHNKTGETVGDLRADEYGNGVVGAYNRKGHGQDAEARAEKRR